MPGGRGAFQVWVQRAVSGWRKKQIKEQEQMKAPPPSKELCLLMAKITYPRDEKLSWTWLFAWGFHEAYVDGWYEGVKL